MERAHIQVMTSLSVAFAPAVLFVPYIAQAQFLTQVSGLFNIFVGLMLTAAILLYGGSFIMWATRLGTWPSHRTEATKLMEWSVVTLFVLVLILMVVQFFRDHTTAATYTVVGIVILIVIWLAFTALKSSGEEKEEHGGGGH